MFDLKQNLQIYFDYLLKYASDITIISGLNFSIIDANDFALQAYGYSKNELLKKSFYDLISSGSPDELKTQLKLINKRDSHTLVAKSIKKNGEIFTAEVNFRVIRLENEIYYKIIVRDFIDRNKLEAELFEEKEQLRKIIDASPASIWFKDTKNNFIRVNKAAAEIAKKNICEIEGQPTQLIFPIESDKYFEDDLEVINSGIPKIGIIEPITAGNSVKWVKTDKFPWTNSKGDISGVIAFSLDITELKVASEAQKSSEEKYRTLFNTAPLGIVHINFKMEITDCNKKLSDILDIPVNELIGFDLKKVDDYKLKDTIELAFAGSTGYYEGDYQLKSSPKIISLKAIFSPIIHEKEKILSVVGIFEDISEHKQIERFFFHDILNTAGSLRNFAGLLKDNVNDIKVDSSILSDINQIASISDKVVQGIISHRTILTSEKSELKLNLTDIHTNDFIIDIIKNVYQEPTEENKLIKVDANFEDIIVHTDPALLSRVVENLIKNAIEASLPGGFVTIGCKKENERISIWVNNQTAISEEIKSKIFKRSFSTKGPGRGIGTYSIKFLTEKYLQGSASFSSSKNEGTTFKIELPIILKPIVSVCSSEPCIAENKNLKPKDNTYELVRKNKVQDILLVDDDNITIMLVKLFLKNIFEIDSVTNGISAIDAVKLKPYSAILMDIHLGKGLNGFDTLKIIRDIKGYEDIPIIAFTAYALQNSKEEFLAAGCTNFLAKPFTKNQLIDMLNEETVRKQS